MSPGCRLDRMLVRTYVFAFGRQVAVFRWERNSGNISRTNITVLFDKDEDNHKGKDGNRSAVQIYI